MYTRYPNPGQHGRREDPSTAIAAMIPTTSACTTSHAACPQARRGGPGAHGHRKQRPVVLRAIPDSEVTDPSGHTTPPIPSAESSTHTSTEMRGGRRQPITLRSATLTNDPPLETRHARRLDHLPDEPVRQAVVVERPAVRFVDVSSSMMIAASLAPTAVEHPRTAHTSHTTTAGDSRGPSRQRLRSSTEIRVAGPDRSPEVAAAGISCPNACPERRPYRLANRPPTASPTYPRGVRCSRARPEAACVAIDVARERGSRRANRRRAGDPSAGALARSGIVPLYPNVMVPLQIDLAMGMARYLEWSSHSGL